MHNAEQFFCKSVKPQAQSEVQGSKIGSYREVLQKMGVIQQIESEFGKHGLSGLFAFNTERRLKNKARMSHI
jgi:hypothetical protein